jgi:predicted nucleic acid-binding protein
MAGSGRLDLDQALAAHSVVALDTSIFIYHFEAHARYLPLTRRILQGIQAGKRQGLVSVVTLMELSVRPLRLDQPQAAVEYEALLVHFPHLRLLDVTRDIARRAARLRAAFAMRPADALLAATVVEGGASALLSNDRALARLSPLLDVLLLDDFAA